MHESIGITPLGGALGAEISGVDLSQPLNTADIETLVQAWNRHSVLVYRDQQNT